MPSSNPAPEGWRRLCERKGRSTQSSTSLGPGPLEERLWGASTLPLFSLSFLGSLPPTHPNLSGAERGRSSENSLSASLGWSSAINYSQPRESQERKGSGVNSPTQELPLSHQWAGSRLLGGPTVRALSPSFTAGSKVVSGRRSTHPVAGPPATGRCPKKCGGPGEKPGPKHRTSGRGEGFPLP